VVRPTIVFGTDFSPIMRRAIPWVREFIAPKHSIVLAHAVDAPPLPGFLRHLVPASTAIVEVEAQVLARLRTLAERCTAQDAECVTRAGRADDVLLAVAEERDADLLVIGAHGVPCRPWRRIGTTAERLLRAATRSLLVANGPMAGRPARILVAVDDAAITPRVLERAGALADANGAELTGVHVLSTAAFSHLLSAEAAVSPDDRTARQRLEADLAEETLRWLRALWEKTRRHSRLRAEVPHGHPDDEILRIAGERSADLIVIGRYGAGRVIPAILGSVVGSVVAGAECPVLVVAD
jgi:nucleotide-binding universal stress UspA family protein